MMSKRICRIAFGFCYKSVKDSFSRWKDPEEANGQNLIPLGTNKKYLRSAKEVVPLRPENASPGRCQSLPPGSFVAAGEKLFRSTGASLPPRIILLRSAAPGRLPVLPS